MAILACFLKNDGGVTAIEYALIAALIAIIIVVSVTSVGTKLSAIFSTVATSI
jgi:pilus assembly protein Flp/PilA